MVKVGLNNSTTEEIKTPIRGIISQHYAFPPGYIILPAPYRRMPIDLPEHVMQQHAS